MTTGDVGRDLVGLTFALGVIGDVVPERFGGRLHPPAPPRAAPGGCALETGGVRTVSNMGGCAPY